MQYYVKPGTVDGGVCHVRGEGSCDPGEEPGDIQVKISVQKHERYTLKGSDLVCAQRVTLAELLRGQLVSGGTHRNHQKCLIYSKVMILKHIDGRTYKMVAPTSPAPQPGTVYIVEGDASAASYTMLVALTNASHQASECRFLHLLSAAAWLLSSRLRFPRHFLLWLRYVDSDSDGDCDARHGAWR